MRRLLTSVADGPGGWHEGAPANCAACKVVAERSAPDFHPDSDVGPWDAACPLCGHLHAPPATVGDVDVCPVRPPGVAL